MKPLQLLLLKFLVFSGILAPLQAASNKTPWWDKNWTGRTEFRIEAGKEGGDLDGEVGDAVVLVRLHQGNFPFDKVREDGADLRAVSSEGNELPLQVEKFDSLMYEAFVWVRVPGIGAGSTTPFWLYFGNPEPAASELSAQTFGDDTVLVYHFSERSGSPPRDASAAGNNAENGGTTSEGSLIAGGLRLLGADPVSIPGSESLAWTQGQDWSASLWIKPTASSPRAILLSRAADGAAWRLGLDNGVPFVEITSNGSTRRTAAGEPIAENSWKHLAVVGEAGKTTLWVDGQEYASIEAGVPALDAPIGLGGDLGARVEGSNRFVGEIDELRLLRRALPVPLLAFESLNQSASEKAGRLLVAGEEEGKGAGGHNETLEHMMLFGDIARNMMFDGWIAVGVCILMILTGWTVAIKKYFYLNKIAKGTAAFQKHCKNVSTDLTAMDLDNPKAAKELGGKLDPKTLQLLKDSPLYHVYHVGAEEIRHRLGDGKNRGQGLSARSIQAIRASLDAGLIHEQHRLNNGIVLLTISIAGGPYVGLLGTVVGVMITFALIAKTGEVEVNSIAPGIASALLATVAGLVVAIPALFIYSYLNSRIRETLSGMQVFIDEFVAKVAEFYPPPGESGIPVPLRQIRDDEDALEAEAELDKALEEAKK